MPIEPAIISTGVDVRGNLQVRGDLVVEGAFVLPDDAVSNAKVPTSAKIDAAKLRQYFSMRARQLGTVSDDTIPLDTVNRLGAITKVRVAVITKPVGDATVTVDIHKNGASILTQVVVIDSAKGDRESVAATVKSDGSEVFAPGDFFEAIVDASIGTGTLPVDLIIAVEATTNE